MLNDSQKVKLYFLVRCQMFRFFLDCELEFNTCRQKRISLFRQT